MKTKKFSKISLLVLTLALSLSAIFAVTVYANTAEEQPFTKLEIVSQNIVISDDFRLAYAVTASDNYEGSITLNVYNQNPNENPALMPQDTITVSAATETPADSNLGVASAYIFKTNVGISFNALDTNFYVQAVAEKDGATVKSAVKRYSVAEYLYQRLAVPASAANPTAAQRDFYQETITWATKAQAIFGDGNADAISSLRYVIVEGGKLDGYFTAGVYPVDSTLPLSVEGALGAKWTVVTYDADGKELSRLEDQTSVTVPSDENVSYVKVSSGTIIAYPSGYYNFENYETFDDMYPNGIVWEKNGVTPTIEDGGANHGNVLELGYNANGNYLDFGNVENGIAADTATAYEVSFDVKIEKTEETPTDKNFAFDIWLRGQTTSTAYNRVSIYIMQKGGDTSKILLAVGGDGITATTPVYEIETTEWLHVQLVQYDGDTSNQVYMYINGDKSNPLAVNNYRTTMSDNDYQIDNIEKARFTNSQNCHLANLYIDNLFCGFTNETKPTATPTAE